MSKFKMWIVGNIKFIVPIALTFAVAITLGIVMLNKSNGDTPKQDNINTQVDSNIKKNDDTEVNDSTSSDVENKIDDNKEENIKTDSNTNNDNNQKNDNSKSNNNKTNINKNTDTNTNINTNTNSEQEETIPEYPSSISLEQSGDLHLSVGDTYQLKIKTNPTKVKNNNGTWASSDESVATVDSTGKITALRNGFCNITFTSEKGLKVSKHLGVYYTILGTKTFNKVIYNQNGITITAKNFIYDMEADSSPLYFSVTNNSGNTIGVFVSNKPNYASSSNWGVTINGKKINYNQMGSMWINYDVVNDSTKNGYISFKQDYLRSNQIRQINTLSFYLIFIDENNAQKFSSDLITINF